MVNMREKYESLSVAALKDLAKARGLKNISGLKKAEVVDAMLAEDRRLEQIKKHEEETARQKESAREKAPREAAPDKNAAEKPAERSQRQEHQQRSARIQKDNRVEARTNASAEEDLDQSEQMNSSLDSGITANGILEVMQEGYGFIRCANYLPGENDVYVSPSQIRRFHLKTGDIVCGNTRVKTQSEKFSALLYITTINGCPPSVASKRKNFEDLTPIFPNERLRLETNRSGLAMRIVDLVSPIGKGQRGMIVSPPKAGKTTL